MTCFQRSFTAPLVAGRTSTDEAEHVYRSQGMDAWILTLTCAGQARLGRGPGAVTIGPGRLLLWPPAVPHDYGAVQAPWVHDWVYFTPRPSWLPLLTWPEAGGGVLSLDLADHPLCQRIATLFADLVAVATGAQTRRIALALAILEQILLWCDAANPQARNQRVDPRIQAVLDRVTARLDQRWSVAAMAALAGISPSRFAHRFRAELGVSPLVHLERLRIDRARELLALTGLPVAAVGATVGYGDPTWFARIFRRHAGMTPRAFRRPSGAISGERAPHLGTVHPRKHT